jgi:hypothetical protein
MVNSSRSRSRFRREGVHMAGAVIEVEERVRSGLKPEKSAP